LNLIFFTDRDLGNAFPSLLAQGGLEVQRHAQHFPPESSDEDWLRVVGERGWVAVTRDTRIRYKPNELGAVVRHRVALLVLVGKAPHAELARGFLRTLPRITRFLQRHERPFIAKVHRPNPREVARRPEAPGSVSLWYPKPPS
jgi:hypothetical protein